MQAEVNVLHQQLLKKIEPCLTARQLSWLKQTQVQFNKYLRTSLGRALLRENKIELNPLLLERYPHELAPTFAHELAHLIAPLLYGRSGCAHKIGWQKVMHLLGYPAERTHCLPVHNLKRSHRVAAHARCGCADRLHEIKPRRLRKMRYGRARYRCLACRTELHLIEYG